MPAPFFTTNEGEFTRLEGVYVNEKAPPGFVQGVFLNVVGVCGEALRGPVDTPIDITSEARFKEVFGERAYFGSDTTVNQLRTFIMNKPFGKVVCVRAAAAAAATAEQDFADAVPDAIINVAASSPGAWGNDLQAAIEAASDANANHFDLVITYRGSSTRYKNLDVTAGNNNLLEVIGDDYANLVVVTKLADGRPVNATASDLDDTAGSDGTIADTDYTGAGRAFEKVARYAGVGIVAVAEAASSTVKAKILSEAQAANDRMFMMWNGTHGETVANIATDAALYRNDRIVYVENSTTTVDFDNGLAVEVPPHSWVASVMSQTFVDVNPGVEESKAYTGGIRSLNDEARSREDYITLKEAGVASWEKDADGGFLIVSGVVNDLTPGKTQITRRRSADYLQISVANRLKFFVKKKNTVTRRAQMGSEVISFLRGLQKAESIVEDFAIDQESVNTAAQRAQGIEKILMRVKLIGHMLHLVLETEIGETVELTEAA